MKRVRILSASDVLVVAPSITEHNNWRKPHKSGSLSSVEYIHQRARTKQSAQGSAVLGDTSQLMPGARHRSVGSSTNVLKDGQATCRLPIAVRVSLNGTVLQAKGDVSISWRQNTCASGSSSRQTRKSAGLFAGGGKLTFGPAEVSSTKSQSSTQAVGSTSQSAR